MASSSNNDEHLQNITLGKINLPLKNKPCQELLRMPGVSCNGWLRRKKPWKLITGTIIGAFLKSIVWDKKYVIVHNGCMYFYNNDCDNKPEKAISLFGYTRVMRAGELRSGQDALWPFKLAYVLDQKDRVHYFSASSEKEMLKWLKQIKRELYKANGVEYSEDVVIDDDIDDLETPISTGNYFQKIKDLKTIKETVRKDVLDSDMEDEYDYIEPDEPPFNKSSGGGTKASSKPPEPPKKPGRLHFEKQQQNEDCPSPSPFSSPSPSSGYYPVPQSSKLLPDPPSGRKKPALVPTVSQNTPAGKKIPPPTPTKPKSTENEASSDSSEITNKWKNPHEELKSSSSVANLRQVLLSNPNANASSSGNSSVPRAFAQSPRPPLSTRISNAPTAVVSPVRKSAEKIPPAPRTENRFARDLEGSAMWSQSHGEGQRYLVSLGQEGVYMLRQCTDGSNALTLLVIADCQLRKYKIFKDAQGMFSLLTNYDPRFDSVHNLLNYYRTNCLPNHQTMLTSAYSEFSNS